MYTCVRVRVRTGVSPLIEAYSDLAGRPMSPSQRQSWQINGGGATQKRQREGKKIEGKAAGGVVGVERGEGGPSRRGDGRD